MEKSHFTNSQTDIKRNGIKPLNYIDVPFTRSQLNISAKMSDFHEIFDQNAPVCPTFSPLPWAQYVIHRVAKEFPMNSWGHHLLLHFSSFYFFFF